MSKIEQTNDKPSYDDLLKENERIGREYQNLLQNSMALNGMLRRFLRNIKQMDLDIESGLLPNILQAAQPPQQPEPQTKAPTPPNSTPPEPNKDLELKGQPHTQ